MENRSYRETKEGKNFDAKNGDITTSYHQCEVEIENKWGYEITDLTLEHRSDEEITIIELSSLSNDAISSKTSIKYETGIFASPDYWFIRFTANGKTWESDDNFYCDQRASDAGTTTNILLLEGDDEMYVRQKSGIGFIELDRIG